MRPILICPGRSDIPENLLDIEFAPSAEAFAIDCSFDRNCYILPIFAFLPFFWSAFHLPRILTVMKLRALLRDPPSALYAIYQGSEPPARRLKFLTEILYIEIENIGIFFIIFKILPRRNTPIYYMLDLSKDRLLTKTPILIG